MNATDLLTRVRQRPFVPFRIIVSEGGTYEVLHPVLVMVGRFSVTIGVPSEEEGLYETSHLVALRHVVRLEPIEPAATAR